MSEQRKQYFLGICEKIQKEVIYFGSCYLFLLWELQKENKRINISRNTYLFLFWSVLTAKQKHKVAAAKLSQKEPKVFFLGYFDLWDEVIDVVPDLNFLRRRLGFGEELLYSPG